MTLSCDGDTSKTKYHNLWHDLSTTTFMRKAIEKSSILETTNKHNQLQNPKQISLNAFFHVLFCAKTANLP